LLVPRIEPQSQRQPHPKTWNGGTRGGTIGENGLCCHFIAAIVHSAATTTSTNTDITVDTIPTIWMPRTLIHAIPATISTLTT